MKQDECIFCRIVANQSPAKKVWESKRVLAFEDIHPKAPVHVLIIPKKHITNLNDTNDEDKELLGEILLAAREVAKLKGIAKTGYRTVFNNGAGVGQSVFHMHLHVLGGRFMPWQP